MVSDRIPIDICVAKGPEWQKWCGLICFLPGKLASGMAVCP